MRIPGPNSGELAVVGRGPGVVAICLLAALVRVAAALAQDDASPEITTQETEPPFKVQVRRDLVLVRAVVRDSKGRAVSNLRKEDFQVLDRGKPQTIAHFAVETPSAKPAGAETPAKDREAELEAVPETELAASTPTRFLALYFDDVHMKFEDLARTREAAKRYLATALTAGDRLGIFTSSGENVLDFTDDLDSMSAGLLRLFPRSIAARQKGPCPEIFDYQAYLIVRRNDPEALAIAAEEAFDCYYSQDNWDPVTARQAAENLARHEAYRTQNAYQAEVEYAFRALHQLVRRMATAPGQRSIVLVSPGFLTEGEEYRVNRLVDEALRVNVTISTLDPRGLFVLYPLGDASKGVGALPQRADLVGKKAQIALEQEKRSADVLRTLAYNTGGEFFHNSNDFDTGFRKVGALPEAYYVLGFTPQNLKLDGHFHPLKVRLVNGRGLTVQARSGYFAPQKPEDRSAQAKEEITQAVFSHDELNELPIEVHTQFFKVNDLDARLSILTHLDLRFVRFRKENGRNLNNLTVVTALFDRNGNYLEGKQKSLELKLLDRTLEELSHSGLTTRISFDVKPGTYLVRQVVRDAEGEQMSALNRGVEIPF